MEGLWSAEHNLNIHRDQVQKKNQNSSLNMGHIEKTCPKKKEENIPQWYQVKAVSVD